MKVTKFAHYLNKFFTFYLPEIIGCTPATIDSYRYSFIHFLNYMKEQDLEADAVEITDINYKHVLKFLEWLETNRQNSISTRNQRQAAINSFVRFLMYEFPDYISEYQLILHLPVKKVQQPKISYLKTEEVKLLITQIDKNTMNGYRDYVIFTIMYTTGIRVSELINIKIKDVSLQTPSTLLVHGKGGKSRYVPLVKNAVEVLQEYMMHNNLYEEIKLNDWLFKSQFKRQFTRQGINYLYKKYVKLTNSNNSIKVPEDFSPHKMRHTIAMELVDAEVDLIYIRDLLGHSSIKSTEIYAKANSKKKRAAIEAATQNLVFEEKAKWENDTKLIEWLRSFNKK